MTDDELKAIERRLAKTTPRAYGYVQGYGFSFHPSQDGPATDDTEFVCHAQEDVGRLLIEVRRLRSKLDGRELG